MVIVRIVVSKTLPYTVKCSRKISSVTMMPVCEANLTKMVAADCRAVFSDFTGWLRLAAQRILYHTQHTVQQTRKRGLQTVTNLNGRPFKTKPFISFMAVTAAVSHENSMNPYERARAVSLLL
jgi:hypothetical protein